MSEQATICFRVDSGHTIGIGHLMRCLGLADAFREKGFATLFICRAHEGLASELVSDRGHKLVILPAPLEKVSKETKSWLGIGLEQDAKQSRSVLEREASSASTSIVIIDHYAISKDWEAAFRQQGIPVVVIDDLSDRPHDCDVLIDQNFGKTAENYAGLVPADCTVLAGPQYALLRPEFANSRAQSLANKDKPRPDRRLFITYGGMDIDNSINATLEAIAELKQDDRFSDLTADVVLSSKAPHLADVKALIASKADFATLHIDSTEMAALMSRSILACGGGGITSLERCVLGLPTLMLVLADNQVHSANFLVQESACQLLGRSGETGKYAIKTALANLFNTPSKIEEMSQRARNLCNGEGLTSVLSTCIALLRHR